MNNPEFFKDYLGIVFGDPNVGGTRSSNRDWGFGGSRRWTKLFLLTINFLGIDQSNMTNLPPFSFRNTWITDKPQLSIMPEAGTKRSKQTLLNKKGILITSGETIRKDRKQTRGKKG